ncbi:DUF4837 family protein [Bacteroides sp. 51]|uniref:DUF4837 family protein n=1 Tax=Bacteroides sp. 51 TaxID=2302938 RepID=UPI0013D4CDDF|nr:DUF4837 family protein [Bacteroides sp. 51]NDV81124.1 DUF4837 family protein [Bacteroides sp. 51]
MKRSLLYLGLAILALATFSSCGKGKGSSKSPFMNTSSGRPYEIIVVVDLGLWERPAGRALYSALEMDVPGLPQAERSFKIMYTAPSNFDMTLKLIRNIVIVDIQDIYTQAKFNYATDVYAEPQTVLTIQAPNEKEMETFVEENREVIVDFFTRAEMNRQIRLLEKTHSDYISTKVASMFDCEVWVLGDLTSTKTGEDFLWASTNAATSDMNFVIYSYPYTDNRTFTRDFYMHKRDSVMKANIPGAKEGMYMSTDTTTVETKAINVQGEYALEARGLWRMKGDFMGGPFVSHTRLDKANNRVVTVEIFVYSPDKLKRNLVRLMEASLYTLKFPSQQVQNQLKVEN